MKLDLTLKCEALEDDPTPDSIRFWEHNSGIDIDIEVPRGDEPAVTLSMASVVKLRDALTELIERRRFEAALKECQERHGGAMKKLADS